MRAITDREPRRFDVVEFDFKQGLAMLCVRHMKSYAKELLKQKKIFSHGDDSEYRVLLQKLVKNKDYGFTHHFLLVVLFSREFHQLKERCEAGFINLSHLGQEATWDRNGRLLKKHEALYYGFKFAIQAYPQIFEQIEAWYEQEHESEYPLFGLAINEVNA
ncbi:hypothetical protein [Vibrio alginolyticus]|uniref:hypothetical protein n=1 Tax=Vibrio TaxID=662 RepID=UPI0006CA9687|nr:hypothetical protein [Vibrio alginolyticus]KPM98624.1 hypothetical protein AOG25_09320 [Vibrio alginolyticus]